MLAHMSIVSSTNKFMNLLVNRFSLTEYDGELTGWTVRALEDELSHVSKGLSRCGGVCSMSCKENPK